jgi:hypothetical protein
VELSSTGGGMTDSDRADRAAQRCWVASVSRAFCQSTSQPFPAATWDSGDGAATRNALATDDDFVGMNDQVEAAPDWVLRTSILPLLL